MIAVKEREREARKLYFDVIEIFKKLQIYLQHFLVYIQNARPSFDYSTNAMNAVQLHCIRYTS